LDKKTFKVQYPKPGTYPVTIKAKDSNANEATAQLEVKVDSGSDFTSLTSGLQIVSLPNIEKSDKGHLEIFVGRQLNNEVVFYLKTASRNDQCWVDTNILIDRDSRTFLGIPRYFSFIRPPIFLMNNEYNNN